MRRKAILPRVLALTAGIRDFDKHLFDSHTLDPSDSGAQPHCPHICVFKTARIGGAIRDTMFIENDASRVSVKERGQPSFLTC